MCEINGELTPDELQNQLFALRIVRNNDVADLSSNNLEELGDIFPLWFKGIGILNLSQCKIHHLKKNGFDNLENLKQLNLSKNRLFSFPAEFFANCRLLTAIDLSHNSFREFKRKTFQQMAHLIELDLSHNLLKHVTKSASLSLERLYLKSNQIVQFSSNKFPRLKLLDLSANCLEKIESTAFHNSPLLIELNLDRNEIRKIDSKALSTQIFLKTICLNNNALRKFGNIQIPNDSRFKVLELSSNKHLQSIDLIGWDHLNILKINNNTKLEKFPGWDKLVNLNELEMKQIRIETDQLLPVVNDLLNVQTIRLNDNHFEQIPDDYFAKLKYLINLYLDGSRALNLTTLKPIWFHPENSLRFLSLSGCDITVITPNFHLLTNLITLDLSRNRITTLTRQMFSPLVLLEELWLNRNRIVQIKVDTFIDLKSLQKIDLTFNLFREIYEHTFENNLRLTERPLFDPDMKFLQKPQSRQIHHNLCY